jgi:NADP-dependent 3-hydroxy acid dehydrogenase YdfG
MTGGETGKVAVITGATGGPGAEVAKSLSAAGYRLVLNSPSMDKLTALAAQLAGPCTAVAGSLTEESLPETLLYAALDRFGRCDVCINNGVLFEAGLIETADIESLIGMVKVNVEGTVRIAYVFLKHFVSEGTGHLINVSHGVGNLAQPTAFAATQSAIEILSDALATELDGTDIHVTAIKPGLVKTGLHARWEIAPEGHVGVVAPLEPEEFAQMVLFILDQADPVEPGVAEAADASEDAPAEVSEDEPLESGEAPDEMTLFDIEGEAGSD